MRNRSAEDEFVITRLIDAPRALVFQVWTDPVHMAAWWGPAGFTTPVCEADVRPGGSWRIVMRGPDGTEYPLTGGYREIVAPERLVITDDWSEHPPEWHAMLRAFLGREPATHQAVNIITFAEQGGRTLLTIRTRFESAEVRDAMAKMGMHEGWSGSLDRLQDLVDALADTADRAIVLSRRYDAPRELVWKAWVEPQQVARWWGPDGFRTTIHEMDVRPGGVWRFIMHGPDGTDYDNLIRYVEVVKPERLVYTHEAPLFHVTVFFDDEDGKTRVRMRSLFDDAAGKDLVVLQHGAIEGGKQHLRRLAEYLAHEETH